MWRSSAEKRREAIKIDSEKWAAAVILHHSADGSTLLIYHSTDLSLQEHISSVSFKAKKSGQHHLYLSLQQLLAKNTD